MASFVRVFPETDTRVNDANGDIINPNDANQLRVFATVPVSPGDEIIGMEVNMFTTASGTDSVDVELRKNDISTMPGSRTTVLTLSDNASGWIVRSDLTLSELVDKDNIWLVFADINPNSASTGARLGPVYVYVKRRP